MNKQTTKRNLRRRPNSLTKLRIDTSTLANIPPSFSPTPSADEPSLIHNNFSIYLGSENDANNLPLLKKLNVTRVLTIQMKPIGDQVRGYLQEDNYKQIQITDCSSSNLYEHFDEALEFLEKPNRGFTLVHCQQGISRSSTICMAYLMKKLRLNFDQSFRHLKNVRPVISPNFGFLGQLKQLENEMSIVQHALVPINYYPEHTPVGAC
jgi:dual specificity MAP kinase phosphatase